MKTRLGDSAKRGLILLLWLLATGAICWAGQTDWPGTPSKWHDYQRYDFSIDDRPCRVIVPHDAAPGKPWIWRARFPDYHAEADLILLERGFHVAHIDTNGMLGCPRAMQHWDVFYQAMTAEHGLASRPALEAVSRGGLFVYGWATWHPDRIACIYADTPVCDIKSWPLGQGQGLGHDATWKTLLEHYGFTHEQALAYQGNPVDTLQPVAEARIPLLHIISLTDRVVPPEENTLLLAERYRRLGGTIDLIEVREGTAKSNGHHFTHPDPLRVADFIERHASVLPDSPEPDSTDVAEAEEDYFVLRAGLDNCRVRFERDRVGRVAFLGGSITANSGWRDMTCAYLRQRFPDTEFEFVAAGIPSTGSTPGAFRLLRDVFEGGQVDLLFEEAAVNDSSNTRGTRQMTRGMEGILRQARRKNPQIDLVVMHFVDPTKMDDYRAGRVPEVIQRHEEAAAHYGASTIHLAREVTERIDAGQFTWQDDFRNLHPSPYGQRIYASTIRRLLAAAWSQPLAEDALVTEHPMPLEPLDPFSYDAARLVAPAEATDLAGFSVIEKCDPSQPAGGHVRPGFADVPMLVGTRPGDQFSFDFTGRAVGLFVAAGPDAGTIEFCIDDGPWRTRDLFTAWSQRLHIPWAYVLDDQLDGRSHKLTVRIAAEHHPSSQGHACRVVHLLVNR